MSVISSGYGVKAPTMAKSAVQRRPLGSSVVMEWDRRTALTR
jgi:hypothetical protein